MSNRLGLANPHPNPKPLANHRLSAVAQACHDDQRCTPTVTTGPSSARR